MNIPHVFAKSTATVIVDGAPVTVQGGSCWPDDDEAVRAHPDLFTQDPRYAFGRDSSWSGEPPGYMRLAPGEDDPVMTAKVRAGVERHEARSRAAAR